MIRRTATEHAPWYVVPADRKWFTRAVVAAAVIDGLLQLDLDYPKVSPEQTEGLREARAALLAETSPEKKAGSRKNPAKKKRKARDKK